MRRHRKPSDTAARFLVSLVVAGLGLFALATIVAPPVTPVACSLNHANDDLRVNPDN